MPATQAMKIAVVSEKSHASEPRKIGAGGSKRSFSRPRDSFRSTLAILD